MKAVRLLVQVYFITMDQELLSISIIAVQIVTNKQDNDGYFVYSDKRCKIDNYPTC
jgi:hypothetical protein